jgi:hypothetical protein
MVRATVMSSTIIAGFKLRRKVRCHTGWLWKNELARPILIRLGGPDDRERYGFLSRPALTCCHGMTSDGFCS